MNPDRGIDLLISLSNSPVLLWLVNRFAVNKTRIQRDELITAVIEQLVEDFTRDRILGDFSVFEARNLQLIHDNLLLHKLKNRRDEAGGRKRKRLEQAIRGLEKRLETLKELEGAEALRFLAALYLEDIAPDFNPVFLLLFRALARRRFNHFVNSIKIHERSLGSQFAIREKLGREPVFFIANHISNADHLPILFALNRARMISPVVIGGSNLYRGVSARILPKVNVCQLKRDDMIEKKIKWLGNPVYIETFKQHNHYMWSRNEPYLFYPEGGRSRSGRILQPKVGIIKSILEFCRENRRPVHFVLISLSYTCVPEDLAIEESRKGVNISYSDIIGQLVTLNRDYGRFKKAPIHVVLDQPITVHPDQLPDLEEFSCELMRRIRDGIRPTPTYEVAQMILNLCETRQPNRTFSRRELESAVPKEEHPRLAAGLDIFTTRGFIRTSDRDPDCCEILNPDLLRQYANRTECDF
jgi:1-acyl-sn-glycerol-3-phosphate acyltransferase